MAHEAVAIRECVSMFARLLLSIAQEDAIIQHVIARSAFISARLDRASLAPTIQPCHRTTRR